MSYLGGLGLSQIILTPLLAYLSLNLFGDKLGWFRSALLVVSGMCGVLITSLVLFISAVKTQSCWTICYTTWFAVKELVINWEFSLDFISGTMILVVSLISLLVHVYSIGYMGHDPARIKFMSYLSLFTFFMLVLVLGNNFVVMFLGWEGVGLCSYLLIGFWNTRIEAGRAGLKAIVLNRVGDVGVLVGLILIVQGFKSMNYSVVFKLVGLSDFALSFGFTGLFGVFTWRCTAIGLFLLVGVVAKSAQLGLHTWLPDAMEGPTPVSALIHAATMVTAGVYLVIRCEPIFEVGGLLWLLILIGGLTAVFGGLIGAIQSDLKKIIAYSTCSQLGYMVLACGLSNYSLSLFHLMNHAGFKALLFLGAGSVIHALNTGQDLRKMGGIFMKLPVTYVLMSIGSVALMGIPFLTGFYSKDVIMEVASTYYSVQGSWVYSMSVVAALLTGYYSFQLLHVCFIGTPNYGSPRTSASVEDSPAMIMVPLMILGVCSIGVGYIFKDLFLGLGWTSQSLVESEFAPTMLKMLPLFITAMGMLLSYVVIKRKQLESPVQTVIYRIGQNILNKKLYFDQIYNYFLGDSVLHFGYSVAFKLVDQGVIGLSGPVGLVWLFGLASRICSKLQSGFIYHYLMLLLTAWVGFIFITNFV